MNRIHCALSLSVLLASASAAADFAAVCGALSDGAAVRVAQLDGTTREGRIAGWDGEPDYMGANPWSAQYSSCIIFSSSTSCARCPTSHSPSQVNSCRRSGSSVLAAWSR